MEAQPNCSVSGLLNLKTELAKIVPERSRENEQCIYKVPQKIRAANPEAYTPRVVSIGPFHHKPRGSGGDLEPMEELKLKYLKEFLNRTKLCVDHFDPILVKLEYKIRSCYAGPVNFNRNDFFEIIIIDACFIIEFFIRYCTPEEWKEKDPLLFKPWLLSDIRHDLILLENQLPFFVLEYIYNHSVINRNPYGTNRKRPSFLEITFHYFQSYNKQNMSPDPKSELPKHFTDLRRTFMLPSSSNVAKTKGDAVADVCSASQLLEAGLEFKSRQVENSAPRRECPKRFTDLPRTFSLPSSSNVAETKDGDVVEDECSASPLLEAGLEFKSREVLQSAPRRERPKRFTDLLRTFLLPSSSNVAETKDGDAVEHVYSASQLSEAGLEFKVSKQSTCLLDIEYHKGVLTMPHLTVHDETETQFRNILAFEECHLPADSAYISQYLSILDFLINTERDVNILIDKKIIANWMGDAKSVATMVNNLCKNVSMPGLNSKNLSICQSLNGFYENPRNKHWAIFKNDYLDTPWKKASTIAAVSLLLLTLIQTICSVWSLIRG